MLKHSLGAVKHGRRIGTRRLADGGGRRGEERRDRVLELPVRVYSDSAAIYSIDTDLRPRSLDEELHGHWHRYYCGYQASSRLVLDM